MGPKTYRGPTGTQKLFNKRKRSKRSKRSRHRPCVFAPGSSFWSEFRLFPFSWVYYKNTGWGAKNRLSHSEGCKRGATERPPQRESKGLITGEVKRCSAPLHLLLFLLLLFYLFRRTRWTPGPGRSRNGTVPVDKDMHMNQNYLVI